MSDSNYIYPEITRGLGELTPALWSRWMSALRYYEETVVSRSAELMPESLNSRITDLELHKPYFFAKLLRAHVLDHDLLNPNIYEYAWVEVRPTSTAVDCCPDCIESRLPAADTLFCCATHDDCETYLNLQGHWNWWEYTTNTSWGSTLPEDGFEIYDLTSDYNPLQYPCFAANASADNCDPEGEGGFPNINRVAYTKPALNILEAFNTYDNAGGVDHTKGVGDFMLQTIGGGDTQYDGVAIGYNGSYPSIPECWDTTVTPPMPPCTQYEFPLKTTPIVLMHNIRESGGTFRQIFSAANAWDGTCVTC